MLESLLEFGHYIWSFVLVLSVIVFVHEFGHYLAARLCGVRVEVFSIGFGRELFGFNDGHGTRWKFSLLPLGGYVKMFGDAGAASTADAEKIEHMSAEEKKVSFHHKSLRRKFIIVAAGPLANFVLSIAVFTYFIFTVGLSSTEPVVGSIVEGKPAAAAGLKVGDRIVAINGKEVSYFREIVSEVSLNTGDTVQLDVLRGKEKLQIALKPAMYKDVDGFGNEIVRPVIGVKSQTLVYKEVGLSSALHHAVLQTYDMCLTSLRVIGQMISGKRSTEELKGPLGIAKLSGDATSSGDTLGEATRTLLWFIALLSVNLGFVNLFPIPMLDGGHLLFYIIEGMRGRPLAEKVQEYSFRFGFAVLMCLMAFTIFNDIRQLVF